MRQASLFTQTHTQVLGSSQHFSVLNLKDVFFFLYSPISDFQYIFLPLNGGALTPRRLPSIPGQCSHWVLGTAPSYLELRERSLEKGTLLQYVDDLLISSEAKQDSNKSTVRVLSFLAERGYKFSPTKAQISQQWIQYLGFVLTSGA